MTNRNDTNIAGGSSGPDSLDYKNKPFPYKIAVQNVHYFKSAFLGSDDPLIVEILSKGLEDDLFNTVDVADFYFRINIENYAPLKNVQAANVLGLENNQVILNAYNRVTNERGEGLLTYVNPERKGSQLRSSYIYSLESIFKLYMFFFLYNNTKQKYSTNQLIYIMGYSIEDAGSAIDTAATYTKGKGRSNQANSGLIDYASMNTKFDLMKNTMLQFVDAVQEAFNENQKEILHHVNNNYTLNTKAMSLQIELTSQSEIKKAQADELTARLKKSMEKNDELGKEYDQRISSENEDKNRISMLQSEITRLEKEQAEFSREITDKKEEAKVQKAVPVKKGFFQRLFNSSPSEEQLNIIQEDQKPIVEKDYTSLIEALNQQILLLERSITEGRTSSVIAAEREEVRKLGISLVNEMGQLNNELIEITKRKDENYQLLHEQLSKPLTINNSGGLDKLVHVVDILKSIDIESESNNNFFQVQDSYENGPNIDNTRIAHSNSRNESGVIRKPIGQVSDAELIEENSEDN